MPAYWSRGRPARPLLGLPGRAPGPRCPLLDLRPPAGPDPGDRARRRRRLRRQVPLPGRGAAAGLVRPPRWAAPCAGPRPAPRTWSPCPTAEGSSSTSPSAAPGTAGSRPTSWTWCRTPAPTRVMGAFLPAMTQRMLTGRVPPRQRGLLVGLGGHHRVADHGLPRGRPARGRGGHRAGHGPVRGRDRHGSRPRSGGATSSPGSWTATRPASARSTTWATTPRRCAGPSSTPATTSLRAEQAAPAGRRRSRAAWASGCRPTWRSPPADRRPSSARSSCCPDGRIKVTTRRHALRPGSRHGVVDDRGRPHRRGHGPGRGRPRRHRPGARRWAHRRAPARCSWPAPRWPMRPRS